MSYYAQAVLAIHQANAEGLTVHRGPRVEGGTPSGETLMLLITNRKAIGELLEMRVRQWIWRSGHTYVETEVMPEDWHPIGAFQWRYLGQLEYQDYQKNDGRPIILEVNSRGIPDSLKALRQWVSWRYVWNAKKRDRVTGQLGAWDKPPKQPFSDLPATSTDPETWRPFDEVLGAYHSRGTSGVGLVLADDCKPNALYAIDLDTCRDPQTGVITDEAKEIVAKMASYTEISPSGEGLHILLRGHVDLGGKSGRRKGKVEIYRSLRYLTITGQVLEGTPREVQNDRDSELRWFMDAYLNFQPVAPKNPTDPGGHSGYQQSASIDDQTLLQKGFSMRNGDKLKRLMDGNMAGYESQSQADLALLSILAFLTNYDAVRTERLFSLSLLALRKKWLERTDYRQRSLQLALARG